MLVTEAQAIEELGTRNIIFQDAKGSADRLRALKKGHRTVLSAPLKAFILPGQLESYGRHTSIGMGADFEMTQRIGSFCAVGAQVQIGKAEHPTNFVSVSNIFYAGRAPTGFGRAAEKFQAVNALQIQRAGRVHKRRNLKYTSIGHDVRIGSRVTISRGVRIATGAVIMDGAIVTRDVAPYAIMAGTPARMIAMRFPEPVVKDLLDLKWWKYDLKLFQSVDVSEPEKAIGLMRERLAKNADRYALRPATYVVSRQDDGALKLFKAKVGRSDATAVLAGEIDPAMAPDAESDRDPNALIDMDVDELFDDESDTEPQLRPSID